MKGWIKVHRDIQSHWIWEEKPFDKRSAWIDILLMANHKDNKFLLGNELVEVEAGSFITSEIKLMERWGWSKSKVRNFLKVLENDSMIVKKTDCKKTTLTIVKYRDYQVSETTEEPQKDHEKTTKEPQKDTNKNDKNDKNDKEDNIYSQEKEIFDYWNSKNGVVKSQERSFDKNKIATAIKNYGFEEIKVAIDRLDKAVLDSNYYYNYKWNLFKFLKQSNGISNWVDDGQVWNDYLLKENRNGKFGKNPKTSSSSEYDFSKYEV